MVREIPAAPTGRSSRVVRSNAIREERCTLAAIVFGGDATSAALLYARSRPRFEIDAEAIETPGRPTGAVGTEADQAG